MDHPAEQSTGEIRNSREEGSESYASGTVSGGIDCAREVDIELGAEAL